MDLSACLCPIEIDRVIGEGVEVLKELHACEEFIDLRDHILRIFKLVPKGRRRGSFTFRIRHLSEHRLRYRTCPTERPSACCEHLLGADLHTLENLLPQRT